MNTNTEQGSTAGQGYDYCPHCHSENRISDVHTKLVICLNCGHEENARVERHFFRAYSRGNIGICAECNKGLRNPLHLDYAS